LDEQYVLKEYLLNLGERQTDGNDDTIEGGLTENSDLVSMETTVENVMEKCETCKFK
jgi:hypothetical protein